MQGRFGFPRSARITNRRGYESVFHGGRKFLGPEYVCYVSHVPGSGVRLGVVASRKVGGAVVRNRIKRYVREYFRRFRGRFPEDTQLVIVARHRASRFGGYEESARALDRLLVKGGILRA